MADEGRPLREELEQGLLWESSEAPLAQAIFQQGEPVKGDALAHLQLIYSTLYGLKTAVLRLADEIDELKTRL